MKYVRWMVLFVLLVTSVPSIASAQELPPRPIPQPTAVVELPEPQTPSETPTTVPTEPSTTPDNEQDTNSPVLGGEPITLIPAPLRPSDPSPIEQSGGVGRIADTTIVTDSYKVTFLKTETHTATNTSTWYYRMEVMTKTVTSTLKLESWILQLPHCVTVQSSTPPGTFVNPDPTTRLRGIKWNLPDGFTAGEFRVTLVGPVIEGATQVAVKSNQASFNIDYTAITGPACMDGSNLQLANGAYRISLLTYLVNPDGTFTYEYYIEATKGRIPIEWELPLGPCMRVKKVVGGLKYEIKDGKIRWKFKEKFKSGRFSITLAGPIVIGHSTVVLSDTLSFHGLILAPVCKVPEVRVVHRSKPRKVVKKAVIIFDRPTATIEVRDGVTYINATLVLRNSTCTGPAWDFVLHTDMDDGVELDSQGTRYTNASGVLLVDEPWRKTVKVDLQGKTLSCTSDVQIAFKYKVKPGHKKDKVTLTYHLEYSDKDERVFVPPMVLEVPMAQNEVVGVVVPRLTLDHIEPRIRPFWERGGGLRIYGFPLTVARVRPSGIVVQYFERARLEYHPEYAGTGFEVVGGLLGVELGYSEPPLPPPPIPTRWYFAETGHTIGEPFRTFWQTNGGIRAFGYPIGEPKVDPKGLLVQYFERVRLEAHPELEGTDHHILLGFLGEECLQRRCGGEGDN